MHEAEPTSLETTFKLAQKPRQNKSIFSLEVRVRQSSVNVHLHMHPAESQAGESPPSSSDFQSRQRSSGSLKVLVFPPQLCSFSLLLSWNHLLPRLLPLLLLNLSTTHTSVAARMPPSLFFSARLVEPFYRLV